MSIHNARPDVFSNSNNPKQKVKEAWKEHSEAPEIDETESVDLPRKDTEAEGTEPDQNGKLEVDNIDVQCSNS